MTMLTSDPNAGQAQGSGGTGNQQTQQTTPDWRTSLPEDLRNEKVFESIKGKDWNEAGPLLAKNYVHAQRLVGADKLVLPTDRSTPEEIAAFRAKLGVPVKPDEYALKLPEGVTEDKVDKARLETWRKDLHAAGIPKAAAEQLMAKYVADEFAALSAQAKAREKQLFDYENSLKQELGTKFDETLNNARYALRTYGSEDIGVLLESTGLGSHPSVVKMFASIGAKMSDDRARGTGNGQGSSTATPELAQHALNEFNRSSENMAALFDKKHPNHDRVVQERANLFKAAYPAPERA